MKNWDNFTRRVIINKSVAEIYSMFVTEKGMTTWFLKSAKYTDANDKIRREDETIQAGDHYHWAWHNWDGTSEGKVLLQNGKNHLQLDFADSLVDVRVEAYEDGRTLVSLVQSNIADDEETKMNVYCGCSCGWTFWLTNLKAYMEHGILLNEAGENLKGKFDGYQLVNT